MKLLKIPTALLLTASLAPQSSCGAAPKAKVSPSKTPVQAALNRDMMASVRRHVGVLASDKLRGRASASPDEFAAARYIAAELKRYGIAPAGQNKTFFQRASLDSLASPAQLTRLGRGKITTNVVGILRGSDPKMRDQAILLSAHLDHLGVGEAVDGDKIYNGADDDASGVAAVLEMARILSAGPRPKRTVIFVLFGSEEIGGYGATYFLAHPPVPLQKIAANLEFEMIGRPDTAVAPRTLWLTGYERSNLGAALASHGARLVAEPHPEQNFFERSDNYTLARRGVVAHTVSSFNLHPEYHQPNDDVAHLNFPHMVDAIASFVPSVRWLCNSDFRPQWKAGQKP